MVRSVLAVYCVGATLAVVRNRCLIFLLVGHVVRGSAGRAAALRCLSRAHLASASRVALARRPIAGGVSTVSRHTRQGDILRRSGCVGDLQRSRRLYPWSETVSFVYLNTPYACPKTRVSNDAAVTAVAQSCTSYTGYGSSIAACFVLSILILMQHYSPIRPPCAAAVHKFR